MQNFTYYPQPDQTYVISSYKGDSAEITFPENITIAIIADDIFKGHTEITSVHLPETLTNIGGFVFDGCKNLKHITLPESLQDMWQYAFTRCGITEISVPGGVRSIVPFTFNACAFLKSASFTEGTKKICSWAFKDCTALTDIYAPEDCEISEKAFEGCGKISVHRI